MPAEYAAELSAFDRSHDASNKPTVIAAFEPPKRDSKWPTFETAIKPS